MCVGSQCRQITRADNPGDVNHVRTWMFGIFHFRHSNIGSSDLSHWNCRPSLDFLCCPASAKLQNVLSMYILYVRCFSSLLDSCPVTPGIVSCGGCSAEHSEIPLSTWKCSCEKGQLCSNDRVTRRIKQGGRVGEKKEEVVQADPVILYIALSTVSCKVLQNSLKILKENTVEIKYFCGNYLVSGCCDTWFSCLA